jgi:hypothetical protein
MVWCQPGNLEDLGILSLVLLGALQVRFRSRACSEGLLIVHRKLSGD